MRTATMVYIDRIDGKQVQLPAELEIHSHQGPIALKDVPGILASDRGWIEWDTLIADEVDEDAEPWQVGDAPAGSPGRCRLYARAVIAALLAFDS